MITKITGTVDSVLPSALEISLSSFISLLVHCPKDVLDSTSVGSNISLFTHLDIKETEWNMYGFLHEYERAFFKMLLGVSGVGPKSALSILNTAPIHTTIQSIAEKKSDIVKRASGIGSKTAEKIVIELSTSVKKIELPENEFGAQSFSSELFDALVSLGFREFDIKTIIEIIPADCITLQDQIRFALSNKRN